MNQLVIICVDDEQTILNSLKIELTAELGDEYLLEMTQSGEEALEVLSDLLEEGYEVAVAIADYIMPGMKGDELLTRIHAISPKTMKIILTGEASVEAIGNVINYANLYRYISKPWQVEDLKLTITEAINSYIQDKKLEERNAKLQEINQALKQANHEQISLISQLQENESRLKQFLEAIPMGIFVTDANGKAFYINQTGQGIVGKGILESVTSEQIQSIYQAYLAGSDQLYPPERDPILNALKGKSVKINDMEIRRLDRTIPIEAWGTPIYAQDGNVIYAIAAFQDISERQQAQAERQRFIQELFELNNNLQLAIQAESRLTAAAERFVPNQFLSFLGYKSLVDIKLGDAVKHKMSVLFSDIRDFTSLSETMTPEENFRFINSYLSNMEPAIIENNGFVDKFIGDAIMALFTDEADQAVKAGISMLERLVDYNEYRAKAGYIPIKIGIGINTGDLILGTVGGQNRMDSTVIGDAVNLAARVESLTKNYGAPLLITHNTLSRLQRPNDYGLRLIDRVQVKGKANLVAVFEVFDADSPEVREGKLATKPMFETGFFLFFQKKYDQAAEFFADCLRQNPQDQVAQSYWERCQVNG